MASPSSSGKGSCDDEKPHVLAVDDSLTERKIVERMLKKIFLQGLLSSSPRSSFFFLKLFNHLGERENQTQDNTIRLFFLDENGLKALEYLQQAQGPKVDLILTDYEMPGMSGYELLKAVKESPVLKEIQVVIISSEKRPARVDRCLECGAKEFLEKPLQSSDVEGLRRTMTTKSDEVCGERQCRER